MKRLKGPQLSRPELKAPPVLVDLYQDLRDRRLLPLLALLVVATLAVPFLLGGSPKEESRGPSAAVTTEGEATNFRVVEATPGLRDYRKRLRHRSAADPFKQRFSSPVVDGAELNSESSTSLESTATSSSTTSEGSGESGGAIAPEQAPPSSGGGTVPGERGSGQNTRYARFTYEMKVKISHTEETNDGSVKMGEPVIREGVRPLTPLPGDKAPVVTFLGKSLENDKAVFMVSRHVTAAFGDAKCISGTDSCELMEVEPGFPETFEYGANQVRYKFNVLKIDIVRAGEA